MAHPYSNIPTVPLTGRWHYLCHLNLGFIGGRRVHSPNTLPPFPIPQKQRTNDRQNLDYTDELSLYCSITGLS